jgi:hypothetical protein
MTQHLSALFRSRQEVQDAQHALTETMKDAFERTYLVEMACREGLPNAPWSEHEIDLAEYAAHGEQLTTSASNRFPQPRHGEHSSVRIDENKKTGHTIADPDTARIPTICLLLEGGNAFALQRPASRWRLRNSPIQLNLFSEDAPRDCERFPSAPL